MQSNPKGRWTLLLSSLFFILMLSQPAHAKIQIVAAENFYGDIAQTLGGNHVEVTNILNNQLQDPHHYKPTPKVAREIAEADIVIYNGADYSHWIEKLLSVPGQNKTRQTLEVASLVKLNADQNPHIWYDPNTMWIFAQKLSAMLIELDPTHKADYEKQLSLIEQQQNAFQDYINEIKPALKDQPVAATEPAFNYMADALGLSMRSKDLQWTGHHGSPSPAAIREMIENITNNKIRVLIYNKQVSDSMIVELKKVAKQNKVAAVGITETQPEGMDYYAWMHKQLSELLAALSS